MKYRLSRTICKNSIEEGENVVIQYGYEETH